MAKQPRSRRTEKNSLPPPDDDDDDDTTNSSSPASDGCCCYYCVHCLRPCPSLYGTLGAGGVVKLRPCHGGCGRPSVDPYCEREWLLVGLDLVLLRRAAYRHVCWNRGGPLLAALTGTADTATTPTTTTVNDHKTKNALHGHIPRFLAAASLLRAHIGRVSAQDRVDAEHTLKAAAGFGRLAAVSLVAYAVQIGALWVPMVIVLHGRRTSHPDNKKNTSNNNNNKRQGSVDHPKQQRNRDTGRLPLLRAVALAVLLPAAADQAGTALALLWENSDPVRTVGSVLVLVHQSASVCTVLEGLLQLRRRPPKTAPAAAANRTNGNSVLRLAARTALFLLLSLSLRALAILAMAGAATTTSQAAAPCPGLAWKLDDSGRTLCFA